MADYNRLKNALDYIRSKTDFVPEVAVVLGSGLGGFADEIDTELIVPYSDLPDFPISTVPGHSGYFVFGKINGVKVVVMKGRVHYYEGYTMEEVVLPVRLMHMMGADKLVLTNASGGINWQFRAGDLMLITDHICMAPSPLIGKNIDELGPRFPDMSEIYSRDLRDKAKTAARKLDIDLREGVYVHVTGPQYETPSEIRMYRILGADAVGMSTAAEAIAARHMGMQTVGISVVSNLASGMSLTPLSHEEVQTIADRTAPKFKALIRELIVTIGEQA